ncbi:MAG: hypothetical protein ACN4GM_16535 [Gammaproteobacteria bacterium]
MSKYLTLFINDQSVFEYERENSLEDKQRAFFDKMDSDMGRGIKIHGAFIAEPDNEHRAKFVAMNLIKALQQDNEAVIEASCAYLVNRRPELIEIRANDHDGAVLIDLVDGEV